MNNLPIGILGGAFDPVHFGHLRAALEVSEKFSLNTVHFVPCQTPVHKLPTMANVSHRVSMLKLAVTDEPKFQIDVREIQRDTPSYMVETLMEFREELGDQRPIALILGFDAFRQLDTWHAWEKLFSLAHIIVVSRFDKMTKLSSRLEKIVSDRKSDSLDVFFDAPAGSIFFHEMTLLNISSTQIRTMIENYLSPRYLMPEQVWTYIKDHRLYTSSE